MFQKKQGSKKKIKKWKIVAVIIVLAVVVRIAAGALSGGSNELLPIVDTAEAVTGTITSTLDTSGTIGSSLTRVYASPINAQVGEVPVEVGQKVLKGDYLLTYDTSSLQKSYDIAELQAKAETATSNDSLTKSNESAADLARSASDINTLKSQIDTVNAEIANLQAQATNNEIAGNNNAAINEEIARLQGEVEDIASRILALEAKKEQKTITDKEKDKLKQLKKEKSDKEKEIQNRQDSLANSRDLANNMTNIQAQLTQKNTQLAELQSKLAEAESKNASAEAGILSESAKANISYTQRASSLTLEQSAADLSRAKAGITADFDGIVTEVAASAGTIATEGTPLITLASAREMCVEISVSKYNLTNLAEGQKVTVNFQERDYAGTVDTISKIAQKSESGGAMVTVKIRIDNPDDNLILGLDAKVTVDLGSAEDVLIVPITAVNSDTTGDFVYVVENNLVVKKYVTTGMSSKEEMEIKSGIEQGEKVITTVDSSIMEGMPVMDNTQEDFANALSTEAAE